MSSAQTTDITCQQARQSHHPKVVSTTIWPLKIIPIFCTLLALTFCCTLETLLEKSLGCCNGLDELYSLEQKEKFLKDPESHLLLTTCPKRARMNKRGKMGQSSASENQLCKDKITLKKAHKSTGTLSNFSDWNSCICILQMPEPTNSNPVLTGKSAWAEDKYLLEIFCCQSLDHLFPIQLQVQKNCLQGWRFSLSSERLHKQNWFPSLKNLEDHQSSETWNRVRFWCCWRRNGDRLHCAHAVASSERWPAALRLPRFSPNNCPTRCNFFFFFRF